MTLADDLRAWAKGSYPLVAATELLLRGFGGNFAKPGNPWIHEQTTTPEGYLSRAWIDFASIPEHLDGLSGGERRFLTIAASLGEDVPVVLSDVLPGLDRKNVRLVLAAVAHAAGSHEHSDMIDNEDGTMSIKRLPSLYPWPEEKQANVQERLDKLRPQMQASIDKLIGHGPVTPLEPGKLPPVLHRREDIPDEPSADA